MTTQLLSAALVGMLAGPWLRGLIVAHAVGYRQPLRTGCPLCGTTAVTVAAYGVLAAAPADGRCPRCRHPIGPVPGTVEAIAAVVLALVAYSAPTAGLLVAWTIFALLGIALAGIDLAVHRLPDQLTVASGLLVFGCAATTAVLTHRPGILLGTLLGAVALGGWYGIAVRFGMGRGDAQLAIVIGAALGWYGLTTVIWATALTYLIGAATVLILLAAKRIRRRQPIPLGVFLLLGALTAIILAT
jgi:leader peptidase (prepilin peptidase)/N-methyltransferase